MDLIQVFNVCAYKWLYLFSVKQAVGVDQNPSTKRLFTSGLCLALLVPQGVAFNFDLPRNTNQYFASTNGSSQTINAYKRRQKYGKRVYIVLIRIMQHAKHQAVAPIFVESLSYHKCVKTTDD